MSSGNIYYTQSIDSTYKYDAEQITSTEQTADGTLTGEKKQWTKDEIESSEVLKWSEDWEGVVTFTSGSCESSFYYDSGLTFTMDTDGAGSTGFSEYYVKSQFTSKTGASSDLADVLDVDLVNFYLSSFEEGGELAADWLYVFWTKTGGVITSKDVYEIKWKKSGEDE